MRDILLFDECDSTNALLKRYLLDSSDAPFCIMAKKQSAGRGRFGKSFYSSSEKGLYISFYSEIKNTEKILCISSMTAVAVCKALEKVCNVKPMIKWVNDIFLGGKKLCGILCERISSDKHQGVVIGIGINVLHNENDFPSEIKGIATSLKSETKTEFNISDIADALYDEMKILFSSYPETASYYEEYKKRSLMMGREFSFDNNTKIGKVIDILPDFSLLYEHKGKKDILSSSEISIGSENFLKNNN